MHKHHIGILWLFLATPVSALDSVGTVTAKLEGQDLTWQVLRQEDGSAMVQVTDIGPISMIDLSALGDGNFYVGLVYEGSPAIEKAPAGITIDMRPDKGPLAGTIWKSDEAPSAPEMSFDRLDLQGTGRMEASFTAVLCRNDDPAQCKTVTGRIDTDLAGR